VKLGSYEEAGLLVAAALVNALAIELEYGRPVPQRIHVLPALARILAVDPASVARLGADDAPRFVALARRLRAVFRALQAGDVDAAAGRLNDLLASHPAHPHLAKEAGTWRLHHHPVEAALAPMWTAICAEGLARAIGRGDAHRLGTCAGSDCDRVFYDSSKNASRRFCSTTCQNRVKTAAFRRRAKDR
jgi:predicted RNA-binding Zn ribbon-like protein